jgi:hypothetical protein
MLTSLRPQASLEDMMALPNYPCYSYLLSQFIIAKCSSESTCEFKRRKKGGELLLEIAAVPIHFLALKYRSYNNLVWN